MPESVPVLTVDIVSDVVCPWCYLGKHHFEQAMQLAPEVAVRVNFRPYQLDPSVPAEGVDRDSYMKAKFGDLGRLEAAHERLRELGRAASIPYAFDKIKKNPNTIDPHRLVRWAGVEGKQADTVEGLFRAYFVEGRDLTKKSVLVDIAGEQGLDKTVVARLLEGDADRAAVVAEIESARKIGVTGVPTFIFAGKYAVSGAQPAATLAGALRQISAELSGAAQAAS